MVIVMWASWLVKSRLRKGTWQALSLVFQFDWLSVEGSCSHLTETFVGHVIWAADRTVYHAHTDPFLETQSVTRHEAEMDCLNPPCRVSWAEWGGNTYPNLVRYILPLNTSQVISTCPWEASDILLIIKVTYLSFTCGGEQCSMTASVSVTNDAS